MDSFLLLKLKTRSVKQFFQLRIHFRNYSILNNDIEKYWRLYKLGTSLK